MTSGDGFGSGGEEALRFARYFRAAVDDAGMSLDQLSAQLMVRGLRTSPATLRRWVEGVDTPTPDRDLRVLRNLEALLPRFELSQVVAPIDQSEQVWDPLVGIPRRHPVRRRLAELRSATERQFAVEVLHDSTVIAEDERVMERTLHMVAQPLGSYRHDPSLLVMVPKGATVSMVGSTGRAKGVETVSLDPVHDLVQLTPRRVSATRPGRLVVSQVQLHIESPAPVRHVRAALAGPVNLFSLDVTPQVGAPSAAALDRRTSYESKPSTTKLEPAWQLEYSTVDAPVGIYDLRWE